jgi:hypothetical protein
VCDLAEGFHLDKGCPNCLGYISHRWATHGRTRFGTEVGRFFQRPTKTTGISTHAFSGALNASLSPSNRRSSFRPREGGGVSLPPHDRTRHTGTCVRGFSLLLSRVNQTGPHPRGELGETPPRVPPRIFFSLIRVQGTVEEVHRFGTLDTRTQKNPPSSGHRKTEGG